MSYTCVYRVKITTYGISYVCPYHSDKTKCTAALFWKIRRLLEIISQAILDHVSKIATILMTSAIIAAKPLLVCTNDAQQHASDKQLWQAQILTKNASHSVSNLVIKS